MAWLDNGTGLAMQMIKVWDPLVRIFHWSLVTSFFVAYFTEFDVFELHTYVGYFVCGLLLFRVYWGFAGTRFARFTNFVEKPKEVFGYLRAIFDGDAKRYIGHNPAGGAMIVALLSVLVLTCISGLLLYGLEGNTGPLAFIYGSVPTEVDDWVEEIHTILSHLSVAMIAVHIMGVITSSLLHRENLANAMITGKKRAEK